MALAITDKPNTSTPDADYPFGNIRDKTVSVAGTSVNKLVYADFHQFFAKLMDYAGVTPNGTPDNETNGFQLMEALLTLTDQTKTKIVSIPAWNMDTTPNPPTISHGLTLANIVSLDAIIINDAGTGRSSFAYGGDYLIADATHILMKRTSGGQFDDPTFSTSITARGFVIVRYLDAL